MSASNRAALINKIYKVLKKYYKPVKPPDDRTLLEHLLYACCLENASYEAADEAFAKAQQSFFDWNEIRVTTVAELAESLTSLPDPASAAKRLKRCLQSVFEAHYAFDVEFLQKQNLGKAMELLERINGTTPFVVAYVSQHGLGGHSIPASQGALDALEVLGLISDADAKKNHVPGLERTIPKAKGCEFASLLHQLGADFFASPWGHKLRSILTEIEPGAKDRLPKRTQKAAAAPADPPAKPAAPPRSTNSSPASKEQARAAEPAAPPAPRKKRTDRETESPANAAASGAEGKEAREATGDRRSPTKQLTRKKPR